MLKIYHLIFVLFIFSFFSDDYHTISYVTFILLLYKFVNNIGKRLLLIESISLYSCVIYLIVLLF